MITPKINRALEEGDLEWLRSLPERWGMDKEERQTVDRILAALHPLKDERANHIGAAELAVGQFVYRRIERLMDASGGTPEGRELSYLADVVTAVEEYGAIGDEGDQTDQARFPDVTRLVEALKPFADLAAAEPEIAGEMWTVRAEDCREAYRAWVSFSSPSEEG